MAINETVAGANSVAINGTASSKTGRGVFGSAVTHRCRNLLETPVPSRLSRLAPGRFCQILALVLGLCTLTAQAEVYDYKYVSLDDVVLPDGFDKFDPFAIDDKGRVYGNVYAQESYLVSYIAVYDEGIVKILQPVDMSKSLGTTLGNERGTVGGWVYDPETGGAQAALFNKKKVKLITKLPGATDENVVALNDSNTALVWSQVSSDDFTVDNRNIYRLYKNGKTTFQYQLPTGNDCPRCWGVNNQGVVAGVIWDPGLDAFRGIRFQPPYDNPQLLDPLPGDTYSEVHGINNKGHILGVSTNDPSGNPTYSIGVWDQKGDFETYSINSTYYFALFNDKNLIVLTENYEDYKSYLVPEPGLLLNLEDLVVNPASMGGLAPLQDVLAINNRGDMIGLGVFDETSLEPTRFLLQRIEHEQHEQHGQHGQHGQHEQHGQHGQHGRH